MLKKESRLPSRNKNKTSSTPEKNDIITKPETKASLKDCLSFLASYSEKNFTKDEAPPKSSAVKIPKITETNAQIPNRSGPNFTMM